VRFGADNKASRAWLAGAVLLAFALRALVPPGFMPGGERPFSIEICPDGFPAQLLVHHHHHGAGEGFGAHCVFAACASGPIAHCWLLDSLGVTDSSVAARFIPAARIIRLVHLPYPRGPPVAA